MALKVKFRTQFPALVSAASPLTLIKNGLSYVFGLDITALRTTLDPIYLTGIRIKLTVNKNFFVATTGSNVATSGLSAGTPWQTIQFAYDFIANNYDLNGFTATINVANGTYANGLITAKGVVGGNGPGSLVILGSATPSNVLISVTSTDAFGLGETAFGAGTQGLTQITIGGMKLQTTTAGNCVNASGGGVGITVGTPGFPIEFGACAQDHMISNHGAWIIAGTNNLVSGGALIHAAALSNGVTALHGTTETFSGAPAFTYYAFADVNASLYLDAMTFAGTAASVTGTRYFVQNGGVIYTLSASASYLPGNVSGVMQSKGNYVTNVPSQWAISSDIGGLGTGVATALGANVGASGAVVLTGATLSGAPSDPTGTTSSTNVMMGLGVTTCRIAPTFSARLFVIFTGSIGNGSSSSATAARIRFGTGAGPANGAAATGTQVGNPLSATFPTGGQQIPFTLANVITGLTAGTTYWFDLGVNTGGTGTGSVSGLTCVAYEF